MTPQPEVTPYSADAVREVLKGITPLPWTADDYGMYIFARGTTETGFKTMVADDGDPEPLFVHCRACDGSGFASDADGEEDSCGTCDGNRYAPVPVARMRGAGGGEPQERNLHAIATVMNAAPAMLETIANQQATIERLREALGDYGMHAPDCAWNRWCADCAAASDNCKARGDDAESWAAYRAHRESHACTCGFSAVLADSEKEEE
jgi:hypothetical protein